VPLTSNFDERAVTLFLMQQLGRFSLALCALVLVSTQLAVAQPQPVQDKQQQSSAAREGNAPTNESGKDSAGALAAISQSSPVQTAPIANPSGADAENRTYKVVVASLPADRVAFVSVGVNATVGLAVLLTLISVRRHSKASEKSAKAALASAEAVLSGERAWIQIRPFTASPETKCPVAAYSKAGKASPLSIVNVGKTPARIMSISGSYLVLNRLNELPIQPSYEQRDDFRGMLLAPQESIGHLVEGLESGGISVDDLIHRKVVAFIHARVIYEDVFGNEHETREGFHLDPASPLVSGKPRLVKAGPPAYHAST
jgi:hypothetical protein